MLKSNSINTVILQHQTEYLDNRRKGLVLKPSCHNRFNQYLQLVRIKSFLVPKSFTFQQTYRGAANIYVKSISQELEK